MELIIAIVIVVLGVAIWYNRRAPSTPVVEPETWSDNGIKFVDKAKVEEVNAQPIVAPVVQPVAAPAAEVVEAVKPKKAPAKKKAPVAKKTPVAKKKAPAKKATSV
jgi:hypothetical protein